MSVAAIISGGFGTFGSIADIVTDGYIPEPATIPTSVGGPPIPGGGPSPSSIDYRKRERIAEEVRALYREIYEKAPESPIADEAAELLADYTPARSPDVPSPQSIDWEALAERMAEDRSTIEALRASLLALRSRLVIDQRRIKAMNDDEEAILSLMLTM